MSPRLRKATFYLVMIAIPLVAAEALAQLYYYITVGDLYYHRRALPIYEADPVRCFRVKPNLSYAHRTSEFSVDIFTNSQGLRTDRRRRDVPLAKPPHTQRLLFLGPSFTFGWGSDFEDAFPTVIGRRLEDRGRRVDIVNLGTPGQSSSDQLCWLKAEGRRYRPDIVVQTVHVFPYAVAEACPARRVCPVVRDGYIRYPSASIRDRVVHWSRNSALAFYAWYSAQYALKEAGAIGVGVGMELYDEGLIRPVDVAGAVARYVGHVESVRGYLGENVDVVFVYVPPAYLVHPEYLARHYTLYRIAPAEVHRYSEAIRSALGELGVAFIDTTEALDGRAATETLYYWIDIHLTPAGNRAVADAVLPVLELYLFDRAPTRVNSE